MRDVIAHFERVDPVLAPVITAAFAADVPITLRAPLPPELYFREIASAITNQQLSVKAAATIWRRLEALLNGVVTPEKVLELSVDAMRSAGVSRQKAGYLHATAQAIVGGTVDLAHIHELDDAAVIAELTKLKGVGPWTAEMFLMFTLGRQDVFSYLDIGLMRGFESVYGKTSVTRQDMEPIVATWAPYRTYAALALWHHRDNQPLL